MCLMVVFVRVRNRKSAENSSRGIRPWLGQHFASGENSRGDGQREPASYKEAKETSSEKDAKVEISAIKAD